MNTVWLRIDPFEALMFRSSGEFDFRLGGYVMAETLPYPRPSTFAGMIAGLLLSKNPGDSPRENERWDTYEILRNTYHVKRIYGPFLVSHIRPTGRRGANSDKSVEGMGEAVEEVLVPVRFEGTLFLISLRTLFNIFNKPDTANESEHSDFVSKLLTPTWDCESIGSCLEFFLSLERFRRGLYSNSVGHIITEYRTGVGLMTRSQGLKKAAENMLYTASFVNYLNPAQRKALQKGDARAGGWVLDKISIYYKIEAENSLSDKLGDAVINFGGENRVVKTTILRENKLPGILKKLKCRDFYTFKEREENNPMLLLTPAVLEDASLPDGKVRNSAGTEWDIVMGQIDVICMGYNIKERRRRPLKPAILEGSILRPISTRERGSSGDGTNLDVKKLSTLGYGTMIVLDPSRLQKDKP